MTNQRKAHNFIRRPRWRGFTLMEMLIVLGILVMLIALAAPRFLGAQKKADIQTAKTQIGLFRGALERYALDMKTFPTTEQGLEALITPPATAEASVPEGTGATPAAPASKWDGPYLNVSQIPLDPWGNPYQYRYPPERGTTDFPDIWSYGPDGQDNTEDDICSWGAPGQGQASREPGAGTFDRPTAPTSPAGPPGGPVTPPPGPPPMPPSRPANI
ncbi:MAG: type II secretion system major pseudopilin GspG [Thermoguttaceae bacterium]|nr:type II secretion system major pseudopilin GspG [Thermoguttaceae bacterium]MDW8079672.1 type II secretion system major pseudopilin GspG [Thermoguttaceae bacterium]